MKPFRDIFVFKVYLQFSKYLLPQIYIGGYLMKKLAIWALAFVFVLSFTLPHGTAFAQSSVMKLVVDGVEVKGAQQPFMSRGQVLIPVEDLFNEAGFKVWKEESGIVNVTNTYLTVGFNAATGSIEVNGKKVKSESPLSVKNALNYVSSDFLSQLEGFKVEVSEIQKTVNVTTNRVPDIDAFLESMMAAELNSYSSKMTVDQKMGSVLEPDVFNMIMDIEMDIIQDPIAMHMLSKMTMDIEGEAVEELSETYFTKDGFFQKAGDKWIKFDDALTEGLLQASVAQADPLAQLELTKKFTKGINIFEYDDVYIMAQTLTNDEIGEMMEEAMSSLTGLLSVAATEEDTEKATEDTTVKVENITLDEVIEDVTEEEFEGIFDGLAINIEEYYVGTTIDKKTLFPIDTSGTTHMTMGVGEDTVSTKQTITGTFSNHNEVEEIKIPADVIKNTISMEEYIKELELGFEKEEALLK